MPRFVDALSTIAATSSFLATLIGVLVLIGWTLDAEALLRFIPGLTAMNPATAIGFICSGCALGLIATQADLPLARRLAIALATVTALLGAARVLAIAGALRCRRRSAALRRPAPDDRLRQAEPDGAEHRGQFPAARRRADDHRPPAAPLPLAGAVAGAHRGDDVAAGADGLCLWPALVLRHRLADRDGAADRADVHDRVDRRAVRPAGPRHHGRRRQRQQRRRR